MSEDPVRVTISYNYDDYIMPVEDALELLRILGRAERWMSRYDQSRQVTTYHTWEPGPEKIVSMSVIPAGVYRMAKAAGKPEN